MEHEYAARHYAVERYLLNELNASDREEFEEHYFACPDCAEAVRTGTYFADNARAELPRRARVQAIPAMPRLTVWQRFAPAMATAAVLLLAVVGYQNMRVPRPELLATSGVIHPVARGTEEVFQLKPGQKTAVLRMDLNADREYPYYAVELKTASGKTILRQVTEAPRDGALEFSNLGPGEYELAVRGEASAGAQPGTVVASRKFAVKQ